MGDLRLILNGIEAALLSEAMLSSTSHLTRITEQVIGAAIAVHGELGPGLLESAYLACIEYELMQRDVRFLKQVPVSVIYHGVQIDCAYRLDLLVEERVIVEMKSVERLAPIHSGAAHHLFEAPKLPRRTSSQLQRTVNATRNQED